MKEEEEYSHFIDKLIKYKALDPIGQIHSANLDLDANHIYLVGEEHYSILDGESAGGEPGVEYTMANRFIKNLNILMRKSEEPILIHMKTDGGYWAEGMAIYDAVKACPNPVTILNYTHARSMSSLIFLSADRRVMMPHATFMFHGGTENVFGTYKQFLTEVEQSKKIYEDMLDIYVAAMKARGCLSQWSTKRIRTWIQEQMDKKEEVYFTAADAVKYGFADEVFGSNGTYDWKTLLEFDS
jgi:ATP-dependent protease ClpP protease subunit